MAFTVPTAADRVTDLIEDIIDEIEIAVNERAACVGISPMTVTGDFHTDRGYSCLTQARSTINSLITPQSYPSGSVHSRFTKADWTAWTNMAELLTAAGHGTAWDTEYDVENRNLWIELQDVLELVKPYFFRVFPAVGTIPFYWRRRNWVLKTQPEMIAYAKEDYAAAVGGAQSGEFYDWLSPWCDRWNYEEAPGIAVGWLDGTGGKPRLSQGMITLRSAADYCTYILDLTTTPLAGSITTLKYTAIRLDPVAWQRICPEENVGAIPLRVSLNSPAGSAIDAFDIDLLNGNGQSANAWVRTIDAPPIPLGSGDQTVALWWDMAASADPIDFTPSPDPPLYYPRLGGISTSIHEPAAWYDEYWRGPWAMFCDISSALTYG